KDHRKRLREEGASNIEGSILADLYHAGQAGFFSAYIHGRKHNDLRFQVTPRSEEETSVISVQPRGVPDQFLYLSHLAGEIVNGVMPVEDKRIVEAESYKISTEIAKNDRFTATTELRFKVLSGGERVIPVR